MTSIRVRLKFDQGRKQLRACPFAGKLKGGGIMAELIKKIIWVVLAFAALLFFAWPVALFTLIVWIYYTGSGKLTRLNERLKYWERFEQVSRM